MTTTFLLLAAAVLAYANGANDNFKGVATLFGCGATKYRGALAWATLTTFAGSLASLVLAGSLVQRFSGKGLVPDAIAASPNFLLAVALGAGLTVILATFIGFPVSTTHGLTGALVGAGLVAVGAQVNLALLGKAFFLPLLLSPVLAVALGFAGHAMFRRLGPRLGVAQDWYVRVGEAGPIRPDSAVALKRRSPPLRVGVAVQANGTERQPGQVLGFDSQTALRAAHYLSAGAVSFARGLNDAPKITALLLSAKVLGVQPALIAVAVAMAIGGWLNARQVAETMSKKITPLNHGQGLTANLVTSALVIQASWLGLPVSTTHVSVGALFGIGLTTGKANPRVISAIVFSWLITLPCAAILGGSIYWVTKSL